ncbi:hypothetical protein ACH5RR_029203 [Cinchona calisaya]|uniref:Dirigent protein n=1 Tax=Cinchona calisaya TaxID=153742 RepID=A0ABD2YQZ5_9GENT
MTLFIQEFRRANAASIVAVAGIPGKPRDFFQFGTVFVADYLITQGIQLNSQQVGRAQGFFATSSLDGANLQLLFSLGFTNKEYNGSTLELQGTSVQLAKVREIAVVSGTRKFRFVKGYATLETIQQPSMDYSVRRFNITIRQC